MDMDFQDFLGKRILIVGEVGSGKTRLLARFIDFLVGVGLESETTLIDLAPGHGDIGRLTEEYTGNVYRVRYLKPDRIFPPRTLGRSREEVLEYARRNYEAARRLFKKFLEEPTRILLVNDLTIYLHYGEIDDILKLMGSVETFAATAYEGVILSDDKGSGISVRERKLLDRLKREVDLVLSLSKS